MDISEKRQINMKFLADTNSTRAELAEKLGYQDTNYVNQLVRGFCSLGNRTARKIEVKLGLPHGWMDEIHPELYETGEAELVATMLTQEQLKLLEAYIEAPAAMQEGMRRLMGIDDGLFSFPEIPKK